MFLPNSPDDSIESPESLVISRASIVLVVSIELSIERFLLLLHWIVEVLVAPFANSRQTTLKPFAHCAHMDGEVSSAAAHRNVREPCGIIRSFRPFPITRTCAPLSKLIS